MSEQDTPPNPPPAPVLELGCTCSTTAIQSHETRVQAALTVTPGAIHLLEERCASLQNHAGFKALKDAHAHFTVSVCPYGPEEGVTTERLVAILEHLQKEEGGCPQGGFSNVDDVRGWTNVIWILECKNDQFRPLWDEKIRRVMPWNPSHRSYSQHQQDMKGHLWETRCPDGIGNVLKLASIALVLKRDDEVDDEFDDEVDDFSYLMMYSIWDSTDTLMNSPVAVFRDLDSEWADMTNYWENARAKTSIPSRNSST